MEGCPICGAPLVRQTDRRRARGYSLRCSRGGHGRRAAPPRTRTGTQHWLTDSSVRCCKHEGCFWDAATCPRHAGRKDWQRDGAQVEPAPPDAPTAEDA